MVDRYPDAQLIVAHAGIADLAALADRLGGKAGVFFDTSVWSPLDLLGLYRLVGPEQVVYASDYPYGQQPASLLISLRTARLAQFNDEQVRGVLAGNANRIADGEPPLEPSAPKGTRHLLAADGARAHPPVPLDGDAAPLDATAGPSRRARAGAERLRRPRERSPRGARADQRAPDRSQKRCGATLPEDGDERDRMAHTRATFRLIHLADIVAVTTPA